MYKDESGFKYHFHFERVQAFDDERTKYPIAEQYIRTFDVESVEQADPLWSSDTKNYVRSRMLFRQNAD